MPPSLTKIPKEPLARFRLLALWFGLFVTVANGTVLPFLVDSWPRFIAAAASFSLAAWWTIGYRRERFPTWGWPIDFVLLVTATAFVPLPMRGLGLFYAGVQFRALYVSRRQVAVLLLTYDVARIVTAAISPFGELGSFQTALILQVIALTVVGLTMHGFVSALRRQLEFEQALKRSDERYRLLAAATRDVFYDWDVQAARVDWSESLQTVLGYSPAEAAKPEWLGEIVHPDDREEFTAIVQAFLADPEGAANTHQYRVRRADGTYAFVHGNALVQRSADGQLARVMGAVRDITIERELSEQLQQSQKMEAIGQLAGGVAHDFNNLLTVIGGHVYMLDQTMAKSEKVERHLSGILKTTERAAQLTKQLLAFSRKQLLKPTVINLNVVVDDVVEMIRPAIGEHVQIVTSLDPLLAPVLADPGQLSQVVVNLAINARDAMPHGGTLSIRTSNTVIADDGDGITSSGTPPADYVKLVVRDTGVGMDTATLERAFDPFFTTKPPGSGTGLGLATVYGIVKQSMGDIRASSAPGEGAAFTILLPAAKRTAEPAPVVQTSGEHPRESGERNVLLVEDDDGVREFAREVLSSAGYTVHEARNGEHGLEVARGGGSPIDLVVTDVVMPRMGGREMVDHLRRERPDLRVLYMTGYTDDAQMLGELRASEARLLDKPFSARALEKAVAKVADG